MIYGTVLLQYNIMSVLDIYHILHHIKRFIYTNPNENVLVGTVHILCVHCAVRGVSTHPEGARWYAFAPWAKHAFVMRHWPPCGFREYVNLRVSPCDLCVSWGVTCQSSHISILKRCMIQQKKKKNIKWGIIVSLFPHPPPSLVSRCTQGSIHKSFEVSKTRRCHGVDVKPSIVSLYGN